MANYLTRFSCLLPLGKPEDVPLARALYDELAAELLKHEATTPGFTLSVAPDSTETALAEAYNRVQFDRGNARWAFVTGEILSVSAPA